MSADASTARCFVPYPFVPQPQVSTGPLAGVRLAVKDIFDVAGYPTGCGNPHMLAMSGIKNSSAPAVQALLQAGAQFVGKVYTDELAFSMNGRMPISVPRAMAGRPIAFRVAPVPVRLRRSPMAWPNWRWAPIPVVRCACRPAIAV